MKKSKLRKSLVARKTRTQPSRRTMPSWLRILSSAIAVAATLVTIFSVPRSIRDSRTNAAQHVQIQHELTLLDQTTQQNAEETKAKDEQGVAIKKGEIRSKLGRHQLLIDSLLSLAAGECDLDVKVAQYTHICNEATYCIEALYHRAAAYRKQHRYKEALTDLDYALSLCPEHAALYYGRVSVLLQTGQYAQAEADYARSLVLDSVNVAYHCALATLYLVQKRYSEALAWYERALALQPDTLPPLYGICIASTGQRSYGRALAASERIIAQAPACCWGYYLRAGALESLQRPAKAVGEYTRAIGLCRDAKELLAVIYNDRSAVYLANYEFFASDPDLGEKLLSDCDSAILLNGRMPNPYNHKGRYYTLQGEWQLALDNFTRAYELCPYPDYLTTLLSTYRNLHGDALTQDFCDEKLEHPGFGNAGVIYYFKALLSMDANSPCAALNYFDLSSRCGFASEDLPVDKSLCLMKLGCYAQARELIDSLIRQEHLRPNVLSSCYLRRAQIRYSESHNAAVALQDLDLAIELNPRNTLACDERGSAYKMLGNLPQAVADYTRAIELSPGYGSAYRHRGECYLQMGDAARAAEDFACAGRCTSDMPRAKFYISRGDFAPADGFLPADGFAPADGFLPADGFAPAL